MKLGEEWHIAATYCNRCGRCNTNCPVFQAMDGLETYSPRGWIELIKLMEQGKIEINVDTIKYVFICPLCYSCDASCPTGVEVTKLIKDARRAVVSEGYVPPGNISGRITNINRWGNLFGTPSQGKWVPRRYESKEKAESIYFPGCLSSHVYTEIALSSFGLLHGLGYELLKEVSLNGCCGEYAEYCGHEGVRSIVLEELSKKLDKAGVSRIASSCPHCVMSMRDLDGIEVLHVAQVLSEAAKRKKLRFRRFRKAVVYHDPCVMSRKLGVVDEPRELLQMIPGLKLLEFEKHGVESFCCGSGGGVAPGADPSISLKVTAFRIKEAVEMKASVLITSCPHCYGQFLEANSELNAPIKIWDIAHFVDTLAK
ncbi:MAG: hypothetical protein DRN99_02465 [Thermoproteota archaeon]|nr:MAG: hypothetical protein DRN99_02465 [Candidatus Korarchaeota archaeon]